MPNATVKTFCSKLKALLSTATLYLTLAAPALAEKIEATKAGHPEHPENQTLIGIFTVVNWIAGIAILSTVVFCIFWLIKRKDEDEDEDDEDEAEAEDEAKAEAKAETKASTEAGESEKKADAKSTAEASPEASDESVADKGKSE